jgi:SOS-response transcriptional repressor LexA
MKLCLQLQLRYCTRSLQALVLMEDERANLDTFPPLLIFSIRHFKRRMRHPSCSAIKLRVKALDQDDLLRGETRLIEPTTRCQSLSNQRQ